VNRTATASPGGRELNLDAQGGYNFETDRGIISPFAGVSYDLLLVDSFVENGADSLSLSVSSQKAQSLRSSLGAKLSRKFKARGRALIPYVSAGWQHEFENQSRAIDAQLASGSGSAFSVMTADAARDGFMAGAGVSADLGRGLSAKLAYAGDIRPDFADHTFNASLRLKFGGAKAKPAASAPSKAVEQPKPAPGAVLPSTTTPAVVPSTTTAPAPQPPEGAAAPPPAAAALRYWVQVGYFPDTRSANALADALNSAHHNTNIFFRKVGGVGYHQVLTGPFESMAQAQAAADQLAAEGHPGAVVPSTTTAPAAMPSTTTPAASAPSKAVEQPKPAPGAVLPSTTTAPAVILSTTTTPAVVPSTATAPAPQPPEGAAAPSPSTVTVRYWIQVGLFPDAKRAHALANALNAAHHNTNIFFLKVKGVRSHQVLTGPFQSRAKAQAAADQLAAEGHPGSLIER